MAAQIKSAKIAPCGKVFGLFPETGTGGPTEILSVDATKDIVLTVNGTPRTLPGALAFWPLTNGSGTESGSWIQWPLGDTVFQFGLGPGEDRYTETGTGWTTASSGDAGFTQNGTYRATADPGATASYSMIIGSGTFQLYGNLPYLCGRPGLTTDAVYTIFDFGGTTPVATFHVDQTLQTHAFDSMDRGQRLTKIGTPVALTNGIPTVVVSNGAGGGSTLAIDLLYGETAQGRVIPAGATVTLDIPADTIVCASGTLPAAVAMPVAVCDKDMNLSFPDMSWLPPFDPAAPHPMVLGYNKVFPDDATKPNRLYFNVQRGGTGWTSQDSGLVRVDPDTGELAFPVTGGGTNARAEAFIISNIENHVDGWGYLNQPRATTWRLEGDFTDNGEAGGIPVGMGFATSGDYTITNLTTPALVSGSTTRWFVEADVALRNVPDPSNWPGFIPKYTGGLSVKTVSQINNLSVTDVGNHRGWPHMAHPEFHALLKGRFPGGDLRCLDAIPTNGAIAVNAEDLAPATGRFSSQIARQISNARVAAIAPVDITEADTDGALQWFQLEKTLGVVKVTTVEPHGMSTGHRPGVVFDAGWAGPQTFATDMGGTFDWAFFFGAYLVVVTSPTTLLMLAHSTSSSKPDDGLPPETLAESHDMTSGGTMRLQLFADAGEPVEDLIAAAVEVGMVPWINVPLTLTPAAVDAFAARCLAATPPGQVIRIEHFNEPWNNIGPFLWQYLLSAHCVWQQNHSVAGLPGYQFVGHNPMQAYSMLANQTFKKFRAAWVAAGRPATDVIRVINAQASNPAVTANSILPWFYAADLAGISDGFDELAGECYQTAPVPTLSRGVGTPDGSNNPFTAWQNLDADATMSAIGPLVYDTGRKAQIRHQMDALSGTLAGVGGQTWAGTGHFSNVKYVNYEGGFDITCLRTGLNDARSEGSDIRNLMLARQMARHPRMYWVELARLQSVEEAGSTRSVRFALNFPQNQIAPQWYDFDAFDMPAGTGDPSENPNPWDSPNVVSQLGGAFRTFAATQLTAATAYAISAASTGTVGVSQSVTVTPNGPYTGTITLAATHGTLGATVFTFTDATPQSTTFTPTSTGTGVISGTNGGGLTDPSARNVTITAGGGGGRVPVLLNLYRRRRAG